MAIDNISADCKYVFLNHTNNRRIDMSRKKAKPRKIRYFGIPYVSDLHSDVSIVEHTSFVVWASKKIIERLERSLSQNSIVVGLKKKTSFILEVLVERSDSADRLRTGIMTEIFLMMFFTGKLSKYQGMTVNQAISNLYAISRLDSSSVDQSFEMVPRV